MKDINKYDDIINLPHHRSTTHPHMSLMDRAAQFAPFAALTGHDEAIAETGRLTEEQMLLDESTVEILNDKLQILKHKINEKPEVTITFFRPDEKKEGGAYVSHTGSLKKIDEYHRTILMMDGTEIEWEQILEIESEVF